MNKKGFTLIELLAVIVILAIIALIAVPIVLNIINDARESVNLRSVENYATAAKNSVLTYQMTHPNDEITTCNVHDDGNLDCVEIGEISVEVEGTKIIGGSFNFNDDRNVTGSNLKLEGLETKFKYEHGRASIQTEEVASICEFEDGTYGEAGQIGAKYHCDVDGDGITENDPYFYVLEIGDIELETPKDKITLILDHNYTDETVPSTFSWNTDCGSTVPTGINSQISYLQNKWINIGLIVDSPSASQIANADNKNYLDQPVLANTWLQGSYWTKTLGSTSGGYSYAYIVSMTSLYTNGLNTLVCNPTVGLRPTIIINKNQLN